MGRLLRASGVLVAFTLVWFLVNLAHPVGPQWLLWLPTPVSGAIMVTLFLRTTRMPSLPPAIRRFWRHITLAATLVALAACSQAVDVLLDPGPPGPRVGPALLILDGVAVLTIVYALYRLPTGRHGFGAQLRLVLDAATVMLATAVFMWHFQTRHAIASEDGGTVFSLVITVLALVAVFALVKVVLSRDTMVESSSLLLFALAMMVGAIGPVFRESIESVRPELFPTMASVPLVFFLAAYGTEHQRNAQLGRRRGVVESRRRSFSVLPYVAVAAVDGLLIYVTWFTAGAGERVVVGAAVILTALVVLRQITALRDNGTLLRRLDHGANHDALTQLPNRVYFHERLQQALTRPADRPVAVALIDLDDFKEVNDTLGHEVGDLLLIAVAQRLDACVRIEDTVARLGGDEFVVVLDDADPPAAALAAERMIEALRQPVVADGHELPIRASIGIADGRTGDEASLLLRQADIAMYAAKNLPGTAYLHFEPGMAGTATDHAHLGTELREAITDNQLFLLYQPIVALDDGRVLGAEALVRWAHPTHGTLTPNSFIPLAERTGLIVPLGRWVLHSALAQLADWIAVHGDAAPGVLNINISARDLSEHGFAGGIKAMLDEYGVPADRIVLEVTETMALEPGQSSTSLRQLRGYGVRVSLDDFGTGQSSLSLLHDCPVDEIKLDRSFTQADRDERVPMAAAVIHLASALGLYAVAEGVETAEQASQLRALGYVAAQGFYFARPMPADRISELLAGGETLMPEREPAIWEMSA
jgi:diguanylate cyclase (GGDEF)-like protein